MLTDVEKKYVLDHANVPEHSVALITGISGGEPYLIEDYFCCLKHDRVIVIGYPLKGDFGVDEFDAYIDRIINRFNPTYLSLIAPELPPAMVCACKERQSDHYYTLDINRTKRNSRLIRVIEKAREQLAV